MKNSPTTTNSSAKLVVTIASPVSVARQSARASLTEAQHNDRTSQVNFLSASLNIKKILCYWFFFFLEGEEHLRIWD